MREMTRTQVVDALLMARGIKPILANEKDLMRHKMNKRRAIADKEDELKQGRGDDL